MHPQPTIITKEATANNRINNDATQKKTSVASKIRHTVKAKHPHTIQPIETGHTHDQTHNHQDTDMTTTKAKTDRQTPETEVVPETHVNNRKMHNETSETEAEAEVENRPCRNNSHIREPETTPPHTNEHQPPRPMLDKKGVHSNRIPTPQWTRVNQHNPQRHQRKDKDGTNIR